MVRRGDSRNGRDSRRYLQIMPPACHFHNSRHHILEPSDILDFAVFYGGRIHMMQNGVVPIMKELFEIMAQWHIM